MNCVKINIFDDGNEKLKLLSNGWIIIGQTHGGGKLKLQNKDNLSIIIESISAWKVSNIN